ncbi:hypothetical protein ACSBR1_013389 [Camellia fascicularis]
MMISVRSLPELSLLKETSIRGLSLSTPKLNSVSENAVCCLWDGELIIVNGDQDMFVVSVLLQKKIYRNLDSVSQVYKKDLIVAQGVISAPVIHKEKKKINIVLTLFEVSPNLVLMRYIRTLSTCSLDTLKDFNYETVELRRVEEKRRWSEGIHQAVEAKEGVKIEFPGDKPGRMEDPTENRRGENQQLGLTMGENQQNHRVPESATNANADGHANTKTNMMDLNMQPHQIHEQASNNQNSLVVSKYY